MSKIVEMLTEPAQIYVGSVFKLKIKVDDEFQKMKCLTTENGIIICTEDNKILRTEWGY